MTRIPSASKARVVQDNDPREELEQLLPVYHNHKEDAASSARMASEMVPALLDLFDQEKIGTINVDMPGNAELQVTVVAPTTTELDDQAFLEALSSYQRRRITRQVVDPDLLAAEVARGTIDPKLVAQFTTTTPKGRSLKRTYHGSSD